MQEEEEVLLPVAMWDEDGNVLSGRTVWRFVRSVDNDLVLFLHILLCQ